MKSGNILESSAISGMNLVRAAQQAAMEEARDGSSVKSQLDQRDTTFGDYRTRKE